MLKPKILRQFLLLSGFALVASTKTMIAVDAQPQSHLRSLSAEDPHFDRFDERIFDTLIEKGVLQLEKVSPSLRLRFSSDKAKVINKYFEVLDVKSVKGDLFASAQYQMWAKRVFRAYKKSAKAYGALFHELKQQYSDYELATFVLEGLASQKTKAVAREYYDLQINDWIANKKTHLDVFRALKLDADKYSVFRKPLLETYVSFARRLSRTNKADDQTICDELYRMLEQKVGFARLAEMLAAPDVDLNGRSVGGRVMNALFRDIASKGPEGSLEYAKNLFNNDAVADSSAVSIWLSHAKRSLGGEDYEKLVTGMLDSLWNQREVKGKALATVIAAAQKDASTREVASNTLEKLFVEWEEEKKTSSAVLHILGLKPPGMKAEDMTDNPLLATWFAFVARRDKDDAKFFKTLQSQLTEEQIASMIVMETADPIIKKRVSSVEAALFNKWKTESIDKGDAFVRLNLDKAGDKLFTHPALKVWYWYTLQYNGPRSDVKIAQIVKMYYDDSEFLLDMVNRELKKEGFSTAKGIAYMLKPSPLS